MTDKLYVALSRVKTPKGLYIAEKLQRRYIMVSYPVLDYYTHKKINIDAARDMLDSNFETDATKQLKTISAKINSLGTVIQKVSPDSIAELESINFELKNLRRLILRSNNR